MDNTFLISYCLLDILNFKKLIIWFTIFNNQKNQQMTNISREFQIFAKPVSDFCNLQCNYCYYINKSDLTQVNQNTGMNDVLLESYISQHIEATTENVVMFSWHGGEPTLAGIDFYRKAVELQKKYLSEGKKLINGIQTNGTLLNDDWCKFFAQENFLVGISMDGPEEFHNQFRLKQNGKGTFNEVINGYRLLQKYGVTAEILCVINSSNAQFPLEIYRFFKSLNVRYITFLPLVERIPGSLSEVTAKSVSAEAFGQFLIRIFEEWVENDIGNITVQIFEETLRSAFDEEHTLCIFKKNCGGVPVIESNGDFYSCDHFVNKEHYLGNIRNNPVSFYLDCEKQLSFGMAKSLILPEYCKKCEVLMMCNGECPKNRFIETPDGEPGLNYLCAGYKMFFKNCFPLIDAVQRAVKN